MPLLLLPVFAAALPRAGALMGVDPGEKRIGVAVSDVTRLIASSLDTIARGKFAADAEALFKLYDARHCAGLVIGHPLNMDGSAGPSAQAARAFARNLLAKRDLPLLMWDERLSTMAVTRDMIGMDLSRAKRAKVVDQSAAAFILQGALDSLHRAT